MAQYSVLRPSQGDLQPWEAQKSSQAQLSSLPPSRFMALRFRLIIFSAEFLRMLGTDHQLDSPINSLRWEIIWDHVIFLRWEIIWGHMIFLRWEIIWGHMKISSLGKLLDIICKFFEVEYYSIFPPFIFSNDFPPILCSHRQEIVVLVCYLHFLILSLQLWLWP